jgi:flagellar biosynthesis/type III secretory pathway M-ring protein FliF/YscJ
MPGSERAEIYFIAAMMVLILIVSFVAVFFFVKTYRKEMADKALRQQEKANAKAVAAETELN